MLPLFFCFYNFGRIHKTLRFTPAMEAGVSKRVWEIADIVALLDMPEAQAEQARSDSVRFLINEREIPRWRRRAARCYLELHRAPSAEATRH